MTEASNLPSYAELDEELIKTQSTYQAAQVHGLICGLLCGTTEVNPDWEQLVLGPKQSPDAKEALHALYLYSKKELTDFSFDFQLFLPDDDSEMSQRTEALGLWCQGFLSGLKIAGIPIENREPGEMTEAIGDMIEIAQVSYENTESDEESELAYAEIAEYIRLSAIMIFQDLRAVAPEKNLKGH